MSNTTYQYPCDRGIPGGPRAYHEFVLYPGASRAVCRYCGTPHVVKSVDQGYFWEDSR